MAINIVVEDGTGKDDANSYVSVSEFISYAAQQGVDLDESDSTSVLLIKAMKFLETKKFKGKRTTLTQALNWPRKDAYIYCEDPEVVFANDVIPTNIKKAEMELALLVENGVDLMPTTTALDLIVSEKIGPITTEYANPGEYGLSYAPQLPLIDSLLSCMIYTGGAGQFRTVRASYG